MTDRVTTTLPRSATHRVARPRSLPTTADEPIRASIVLLPLRLFLAAGWLRAAAEKLIDHEWWSGEKLRSFLDAQHRDALPFFRPVMDSVIAPYAVQVAAAVAILQLLIGLALLVGRPLRTALWAGIVLNVVFVLCGRVNPSAFYLVMEASLLYAVSTGHLGRGVRTPTARSFLTIGAWLAVAGAMAPFVRTLEPAEVIDDPAMMLVFLSLVMAATTFARWLHHHGDRITDLTELSLRPVHSWLGCGVHRRPQLAATELDTNEQLERAWHEMTNSSASA
jgi:thiosulfate dehydrogenase (quinone) large subunit